MNTRIIITAILLLVVTGCSTTRFRGSEIRNRVADTPGLATHNITIDEPSAGRITLNGTVSSERDRETIERVARNTPGVKEVRSNLIVEPSTIAVREGYPTSGSDSRILVSDITSRISNSRDLRDYNLNVSAVGSVVTLRGEVGNEFERSEAERIALDTPGVTSVRNDILVINSARSDYIISRNVRDTLMRRSDIDLRDVEISTRDSIVTLRGSQLTRRDIDNLVTTTRSVSGVRDVRNELTLVSPRYDQPRW